MKIDGVLLSKMFRQAAATLNANKNIVDALNVFPVPDGDTGTNMSLTMNSAMNEIGSVATGATVEVVAKAMSKGSLMGARGNSGVILSQIFRGFAKGCHEKQTLSSIDFAHALKSASDIAYKAVMKPVEGTILTVIRKTGELALDFTETEVPIQELMENLIKRAEETLERTPDYLPVLKQAGVVDAGGKGLVYIFLGFLDAILGKEVEIQVEKSEAVIKYAGAAIDADTITFSYCTEFILQTARDDVAVLRSEIQKLGDSMVFVHDESLVKVHVHTDTPGIALEKALKFGALMSVKIENMREQHSALDHGAQLAAHAAVSVVKPAPKKSTYGIIAVSIGDGFAEIFRDLGVTQIVEGGQTMNPSTEDFLKAAEECHAEHIIILPNNSNIILAANQAKEVSSLPITVIPTKSIPQGITTLIEFDAELSPEENEAAMTHVIPHVKTLQVTYSVRDTQYGEIEIKKDDILGVGDGNIIAVGNDIETVTLEALEKMVDEDASILTIYFGEEVSETNAAALAERLANSYKDVEIEMHGGGQPLYYYVISIE
jgi:DAK2 domain fusion protein YloV